MDLKGTHNSANASVNEQPHCHSLHAQFTISKDEKETGSTQGFTHPLILGQWVVDHQILVAFGLARVGDVL